VKKLASSGSHSQGLYNVPASKLAGYKTLLPTEAGELKIVNRK